ncbi:MAG: hypothetical protein AAGF12_14010 [Myxococcota bacterium]
MIRTYRLASGRLCRLRAPWLPFVDGYHVLFFPEEQGTPTPEEMDEMARIAFRAARAVGARAHDDPECYTVLYNGARARRRPWVHFHLLPARSVAKKRWAIACLCAKRWTRRWARPQETR